MEALRLQLADLERRWEDDHIQLVRLAAAGDGTHDVFQRESGSALDLQFAAAEKRVRMSAQDAGNRGKDGGASFKGASSRCRCVTADADGKRGIATNHDTTTFNAIRRVVAGGGTNTHAPRSS